MWTQERSDALNAFINRESRRSFDDGLIAGLRIQEYWHTDILPRGSEQEITFYVAPSELFDDIRDFAALVTLFEWEDSIAESARSTFKLDTLTSIARDKFEQHWFECAAKVNAPLIDDSKIDASFAVTDEWNDKFYVANDKNNYYAVCWSTTA